LNLTLLLQSVDLFLIEEFFITIAPLEEWGRHIFTKGTTHGQGQCPPRLNWKSLNMFVSTVCSFWEILFIHLPKGVYVKTLSCQWQPSWISDRHKIKLSTFCKWPSMTPMVQCSHRRNIWTYFSHKAHC
jgi:hypothetical protein